MEPQNLSVPPDTEVQRHILESVVEAIERSCESAEQALHVQTAHCSEISSLTRYLQVIEHYKHHCFDWTDPKYRVAAEYLHFFVNLCEEAIPLERIKTAIEDVGRKLNKHLDTQ